MQGKSINDLYKTFVARLEVIYGIREAQGISEWALMHLLSFKNKADFLLSKHHQVSEEVEKKANTWLDLLCDNMPIQHLIGEVEFYGVKIKVTGDVLIPRPETEELVHLIIQDLPNTFCGKILDVGTGSGCIALALKKQFPNAEVSAVDVSPKALAIASENGRYNGLDILWLEKDILSTDETMLDQYDVIVSNPPYIPLGESDKMARLVVKNEPSIALFTPDEDPMLFYRSIGKMARKHLNSKGAIYFELHEEYANDVLSIMIDLWPTAKSQLIEDLQDKKRFLKTQT